MRSEVQVLPDPPDFLKLKGEIAKALKDVFMAKMEEMKEYVSLMPKLLVATVGTIVITVGVLLDCFCLGGTEGVF